MGGQQTKLTVNSSNEAIVKAIFTARQDCSTDAIGNQSITLRGSNIVVDGVTMTQDMKVDGSCVLDVVNDLDSNQDLQNAVGQGIQNQGVAGLEWMNAGKDEQNTNISNVVRETSKTEILGKCIQKYLATQSINAQGNNIIIKNTKMDQVFEGVSKCTLTATSSTKAATVLANKTNQSEKNVSENPLNFLSDLMESWGDSMGKIFTGMTLPIIIAVIMIALVIGISIFTGHHHKYVLPKRRYPLVSAPQPQTATQQQAQLT